MSDTEAAPEPDKLRELVAVLEFGELFPPSKVSDPPPNLGPLWAAARRLRHAESG